MKAITDTEADTLPDRRRFTPTISRGECDG
mgnify:CR=1 FL=1